MGSPPYLMTSFSTSFSNGLFEEKELDVLADDMTLDTFLKWHEETLTQQEQEQVLVQQVLEEQDYQDKLIVMAIVKDEEERHGSPER